MNAELAQEKYSTYCSHTLAMSNSFSRALVRSIDALLLLLEPLLKEVDGRPLDLDVELTSETRAAYDSVRRLGLGVRRARYSEPWLRFADLRAIEQPLPAPDPILLKSLDRYPGLCVLASTPAEAYEAVDQRLCAQLRAIRESAGGNP